jgi:hypothetical protein
MGSMTSRVIGTRSEVRHVSKASVPKVCRCAEWCCGKRIVEGK